MKPEEMVGKHIFENVVLEEQSMPRHCYLSKRDFDEHGCSSDCPGCLSILKGIRRQGHREACRQRLQKALEGTDRLERAKAREHEFYEEVWRREDKKQELGDGGPEEWTREFRRVIIRGKLEAPHAFLVRRRDHPDLMMWTRNEE